MEVHRNWVGSSRKRDQMNAGGARGESGVPGKMPGWVCWDRRLMAVGRYRGALAMIVALSGTNTLGALWSTHKGHMTASAGSRGWPSSPINTVFALLTAQMT